FGHPEYFPLLLIFQKVFLVSLLTRITPLRVFRPSFQHNTFSSIPVTALNSSLDSYFVWLIFPISRLVPLYLSSLEAFQVHPVTSHSPLIAPHFHSNAFQVVP